jgi:hypothetical protein
MFHRPNSEEVPRTVARYLLAHEKQAITVHKHPAVFAVHFGITIAALASAGLLTIMTSSDALVLAIVWGACLVLFLSLAIRLVVWNESYFVVTSGRMIFITGPVVRKAITVPIREIRDLSFYRTRPGYLFGYGTFVVEQTTHNYTIPSMNYMPYPEQIYVEVYNLLFGSDATDSQ